MKRWALVAFGGGAYAVALAAMAPATLLDAYLDRATSGRLRLVEASGSVWSGSASLEARDPKLRPVVAKPLAWRIAPVSLLRGAIEAQASIGESALPVTIVATRSRAEISRTEITVSAAAFALLVPRLTPLQPTGTLSLRIEQLALERNAAFGSGTVQWQPAGSALSNVFPLGGYELRFEAAGGEGRAHLRTLDGPLRLSGNGTWRADGGVKGSVLAEVPAAYRETLSPLLRLIARERADGRFDVELQ